MAGTSQHTPSKIFVTGGTGLVGSHLIDALVKQGSHVVALYRTAIPDVECKDKVEWVKGDLDDILRLEELLQSVDQVYHCAAIVSFNPAERNQMFKINVEGTSNVVNAAINNNVRKLCYVSSVAALGRIRKGEEVNETMHWTKETSNSEYGKSKYLAEMEVWRGIGEGLPAVIVNPSIILGAGNWNKGGSTKLFKSAYEEFPWYTEGVSGFVDVNDVISAMIQLMNTEVTGQRFILNGINCSYQKLLTDIATSFSKRPPHKFVTPFIASVVWRWEALKAMFSNNDPLVTRETTLTAQAKVYYNNSKIKNYLPSFEYSPFTETIERICNELKVKYKL